MNFTDFCRLMARAKGPKMIEDLVHKRANGAGFQTIALALGTARNTVKTRLKELGAYEVHEATAKAVQGIELIAPDKESYKNKIQDGRKLRRYKNRWKIERLNAWLQNFRRLTVRWEYKAENYLSFLTLGACLLLLRHF